MPATLGVPGRSPITTYEPASKEEFNVLSRLAYAPAVKALVGLLWRERLCALPAEMLCVPYWLTGCSVDEIQEERYDEFNEVRQEFMRIFQEQERRTRAEHGILIADVMSDMWDSKAVWFCAEKVLSRFWCEDSETVVQTKLADRKDYDAELKRVFGE